VWLSLPPEPAAGDELHLIAGARDAKKTTEVEEVDREFYDKVLEMMARRRPFALATVVAVRGSSSAKPGSKAVIDEAGRNLLGWLGGGCAQSFICEEAMKALGERKTRVVTADLDDEVLGVGMPCGGFMDVYIEPVLPRRRLLIAGHDDTTPTLALLAGMAGFEVFAHVPEAARDLYTPAAQVVASETLQPAAEDYVLVSPRDEDAPGAVRRAWTAEAAYVALLPGAPHVTSALTAKLCGEGHTHASLSERLRLSPGLLSGCRLPAEIALSIVAELLTVERRASGKSLGVAAKSSLQNIVGGVMREPLVSGDVPKLVITGHSRITEELARLGELFGWPTTINDAAARPVDYSTRTCIISQDPDFARLHVDPQTFVVIASHHKGDHLAILKALKDKARYIGLVASRKRSNLILDYLSHEAGSDGRELARFYAPAGLDLGAVTPSEIAVSIMSEMLTIKLSAAALPGGSLYDEGQTDINDRVAAGV
jgi:xanthine dehydrogenase accessory factor